MAAFKAWMDSRRSFSSPLNSANCFCLKLVALSKESCHTQERAKRETANGRNRFLQKSAVSCGFLRERELNPNFFFSNFSGTPGISRQNPGISRQKSLISLVSKGIPNFLAPTPSRGRPLPHRKISGLKSLGLCSFFVPDSCENLRFPAQICDSQIL